MVSAKEKSQIPTQAMYRRWRPPSFAELAGQEHVSAILRQAVRTGRVAQSYLFCGPRGCGKTTSARIIAKAANCEAPQDGDPCNRCPLCRAADGGQLLEITELDAASNRGVDEMREVRETLAYAPVRGKRKVYIIDEAHMLTTAAAGIFGKILEDPPEHVMFVLCTTEAHRLPPEVVSRCQRLDFRRIPSATIYRRLDEIAGTEGIPAEKAALQAIARKAGGSLRDAENLLEQLAVTNPGGVRQEETDAALGMDGEEDALELVAHMVRQEISQALLTVQEAGRRTGDYHQLQKQTIQTLRALLHAQWNPAETLDMPEHATAALAGMATEQSPARTMEMLRIWSGVNLRRQADAALALELAAAETCNLPREEEESELIPQDSASQNLIPQNSTLLEPVPQKLIPQDSIPQDSIPQDHHTSDLDFNKKAQRSVAPSAQHRRERPEPTPQPEPAPEEPKPQPPEGWQEALRELSAYRDGRYNLGALLRNCRAEEIRREDGAIILPFSHRANMERLQGELENGQAHRKFTETLDRIFGAGREYRLSSWKDGKPRTVTHGENSPLVRAALNMGARVIDPQPARG